METKLGEKTSACTRPRAQAREARRYRVMMFSPVYPEASVEAVVHSDAKEVKPERTQRIGELGTVHEAWRRALAIGSIEVSDDVGAAEPGVQVLSLGAPVAPQIKLGAGPDRPPDRRAGNRNTLPVGGERRLGKSLSELRVARRDPDGGVEKPAIEGPADSRACRQQPVRGFRNHQVVRRIVGRVAERAAAPGAEVEPVEVELDAQHEASGLPVVPGLAPERDAVVIQIERSGFLDTGDGRRVEVIVRIVLDRERSALLFGNASEIRAEVKAGPIVHSRRHSGLSGRGRSPKRDDRPRRGARALAGESGSGQLYERRRREI